MTHQLDRYTKTNYVKRKVIASDVRHKMAALKKQLIFNERLVDTKFSQDQSNVISQAVFAHLQSQVKLETQSDYNPGGSMNQSRFSNARNSQGG